MCNKEQLVGYLYGELTPAEARAFEAHLAACAACRQEADGLGRTRQHLASWDPPEPALDFQIVAGPRPVDRPRRRWIAAIPQWGLGAAAALIVLAGAAAIARVEVRYSPEGFSVRTGWPAAAQPVLPPAASPAPAAVPVQAGESTAELRAQVAALLRRVDELESDRKAPGVAAASASRAGVSVSELRKILDESEARQRAELAAWTTQVWKDFSAARASDFARFQQTLGQAQGLTNFQLRQQRDSIESLRYLHSVSLQK